MVIHRGIRNVAKELAEFDATKPTIFIDVDGVINPIRRQREWIGPKNVYGGYWDPAYSDPANWVWYDLVPDPELHYPVSRRLTVDFDRWLDQPQSYIEDYLMKQMPTERYQTLQINLMDEMLDELRAVIEQHDLQVVYLTYWRSEALRLLEPELRLGATTYLDWFTGSGRGHRLKIDALRELYEEADIRTPFIILDDESTEGLNHDSKLWLQDHEYVKQYPKQAAQAKALNSIPKLIFQQDAKWGIERAHVEKIRKFAESLTS
jgi:hypothetical protein